MTDSAQEFSSFGGGLNLRDKADAIDPAQCVDALNVEFTQAGSVRQRDGYTSFAGTLSESARTMAPFYTTSGTHQLLVGGATRLDALATDASTVASATGLGSGTAFSFVRFAAPGSEYAYACNGQNTMRRWNGTAWAAPTATVDGVGALAMPMPSVMAVMSPSNRLVASGFFGGSAGPNGATTNPSTVYFSNAGDPQGWGTTAPNANFIQVTPGDGEAVQATIAWRNLVFVFKETKFFVVYGESVDGSGSPIFNYRTVDTGVGCAPTGGSGTACAGPDGVYFLDRTGLYRTTGGPAELLSDLVTPIFDGSPTPYLTTSFGLAIPNQVCYFDHKVYCLITVSAGVTKTLIYDTRFGTWTVADFPARFYTTFRQTTVNQLFFSDVTSSIFIQASSYTNDNGSAISSKWRSGWQDFGLSDDKTIRESKIWGSGKASLAISKDFGTAVGTANLVDMTPSSAALKGKLSRYAVRGTTFSTSFSNSTKDQAWEVHRLAHHLREQRIESVVTA